MLSQERYSKILSLLGAKGTVSISELVEITGTSESTIRRDLNDLDKLGKLCRVHGGATAINQEFVMVEDDVYTKSNLYIPEKQAIAKYAASIIQDEDIVYIDAGTSTELIIDYITSEKTMYVTNGIVHAKKLMARGYKTYIIGGMLKTSTEAVIGAEAVNSLRKYNFTKAFLGTNGIHLEYGYTTMDPEEAMVKEEVVNRSYVNYILADNSKFDKISAVTFADIKKACIITDKIVKDKYKEATFTKEVL